MFIFLMFNHDSDYYSRYKCVDIFNKSDFSFD